MEHSHHSPLSSIIYLLKCWIFQFRNCQCTRGYFWTRVVSPTQPPPLTQVSRGAFTTAVHLRATWQCGLALEHGIDRPLNLTQNAARYDRRLNLTEPYRGCILQIQWQRSCATEQGPYIYMYIYIYIYSSVFSSS